MEMRKEGRGEAGWEVSEGVGEKEVLIEGEGM